MLSVLIGLVIVVILLVFVLRPLLEARSERQALVDSDDTTLETLLFERENMLTALRDIRFDREMGKLSEDDFSELEAQYRARAIKVLKELDALGAGEDTDIDAEDALDMWIEVEVQARRRAQPADDADAIDVFPCPQCGERLRAGDRFCSQCGVPVAAEVNV